MHRMNACVVVLVAACVGVACAVEYTPSPLPSYVTGDVQDLTTSADVYVNIPLPDGSQARITATRDLPGHDVEQTVSAECARLNVSAAICAQARGALQEVYDRMMGFGFGYSHEGKLRTAAKFTDHKYWEAICPDLHVGAQWPESLWQATAAESADRLENIAHRMKVDGYFKYYEPKWTMPATHATLAECVVNLRKEGLPGVFGYMYDEFWMFTRRLHGIVRSELGENALIMPDIWVFNIDPKHGEPKGWGPHRDRPSAQPIMADGRAASINFWLPLTEATTLNGCMYILPKQFDDRDPHSPAWQNMPTDRIPERDAPRMKQLQHVRALPAQPGEILGWDGWVLHWGSAAQRDPPHPARISIAIEFQAHPLKTRNHPMNSPLMTLDYVPSPVERLGMVCKQVRNYKHIREKVLPWVETLCNNVDNALMAAGLPTIPPRDLINYTIMGE